MNCQPRVSVILTYFNYRDYLPASIASVQSQTYSNVELIVVDDCGPDLPPLDIGSLLAGNSNAKVVHHPHNLGLPVARNSGIASSTGDLLVIMDSDDLLAPTFIEETVQALVTQGLDGVYTLVQTFGARDYLWTPDCSLLNLLVGNPGPATFLMRRQVFDAIGCYKPQLPLNSDHDFWIEIAKRGFKFSRLDQPLYFYRKHDRSLSSVHRDARWSAVPTLYDYHKELYDTHVKELLALRESQYRQLEYEYDKIWQGWYRADQASRVVHARYEAAESRIRFADMILQSTALRPLLWAYRKLCARR